jgi:hypothetical protein
LVGPPLTASEDQLTEVPEHLLKRSQDRRAALGLGGGGDAGGDAAPAAAPAASASTEVATTSAAAATSAGRTPVVEAAPPAPVFVPPYVEASERRQRIPMWAFPVLAFLPVWAVIYAQSLSAPPPTTLSQVAAGAVLYNGGQPCSGCHGSTGGGGTGRPLANGEVVKTFPNIAGQLQFVWLGTDGFNGQPYGNPNREGGPHIAGTFNGAKMPTFKGVMTQTELLEVVRHERETLGGEDPTLFKVDAAGNRLWANGKPMLNAAGLLVWDDGTLMFDSDGKLTKQVDESKPES